MDEDGHLQPLGKELVDLFHAMGAGERPVFGHDPAGGGADKAGQQQQYHQGPQRIVTGVVGVAPLDRLLEIGDDAGRCRQPLGEAGMIGADESPYDAQCQQSGQRISRIAVVARSLFKDEEIRHAQQHSGPVKSPDHRIPYLDFTVVLHRLSHEVIPLS